MQAMGYLWDIIRPLLVAGVILVGLALMGINLYEKSPNLYWFVWIMAMISIPASWMNRYKKNKRRDAIEEAEYQRAIGKDDQQQSQVVIQQQERPIKRRRRGFNRRQLRGDIVDEHPYEPARERSRPQPKDNRPFKFLVPRSWYWCTIAIVGIIIGLASMVTAGMLIFIICLLVPVYVVIAVARGMDAGLSWKYGLLTLIPILGLLVMFELGFKPPDLDQRQGVKTNLPLKVIAIILACVVILLVFIVSSPAFHESGDVVAEQPQNNEEFVINAVRATLVALTPTIPPTIAPTPEPTVPPTPAPVVASGVECTRLAKNVHISYPPDRMRDWMEKFDGVCAEFDGRLASSRGNQHIVLSHDHPYGMGLEVYVKGKRECLNIERHEGYGDVVEFIGVVNGTYEAKDRRGGTMNIPHIDCWNGDKDDLLPNWCMRIDRNIPVAPAGQEAQVPRYSRYRCAGDEPGQLLAPPPGMPLPTPTPTPTPAPTPTRTQKCFNPDTGKFANCKHHPGGLSEAPTRAPTPTPTLAEKLARYCLIEKANGSVSVAVKDSRGRASIFAPSERDEKRILEFADQIAKCKER